MSSPLSSATATTVSLHLVGRFLFQYLDCTSPLVAMLELLLYPRTQPGVKDPQDTSISEALESCFPCMMDGGRLNWNGVLVPISYKYDLSIIVHDIVALVRQLRTCLVGSFSINWPSNTFHASWRITIAGGRVQVAASWYSVSAQDGPLKGALNATPMVETAQADMRAQWVGLLRFANQTLLDTGYRPDELAGYRPLTEELTHYAH